MEYALDRFPQFVEDYQEYFSYLREFDEALAVRHYLRFENALLELLLRNPLSLRVLQRDRRAVPREIVSRRQEDLLDHLHDRRRGGLLAPILGLRA
jgi:hypothetical protein